MRHGSRLHRHIHPHEPKRLKVVLVDGEYVRNHYGVNFALAGNDKAYSFIPKGQIWVEKTVPAHDRRFIILHENAERVLMGHGMGYDEAYHLANKIEGFQRGVCK